MGVLLDNQKAVAALVERCRSLEERVARLEDRVNQSLWDKLVRWFKGVK